VGLERGPLSLVSTIEELHGRKSSGFGLESREYCHRAQSHRPRSSIYPQNVGTNFADKQRSLDKFARGLRPWSLVFFICTHYVSAPMGHQVKYTTSQSLEAIMPATDPVLVRLLEELKLSYISLVAKFHLNCISCIYFDK
jgi:hypothetical protein